MERYKGIYIVYTIPVHFSFSWQIVLTVHSACAVLSDSDMIAKSHISSMVQNVCELDAVYLSYSEVQYNGSL